MGSKSAYLYAVFAELVQGKLSGHFFHILEEFCSCSSYLISFELQKTFGKPEDEFNFWCDLIKGLASRENLATLVDEASKKVNDYAIIRALQFFSTFLRNYPLCPAHKANAGVKSSSQEDHRIITRHQKTLESLSQTRITRNKASLVNATDLQELVENSPRKLSQDKSHKQHHFHVNVGTAHFLEIIFGQCLQHENTWIRKWALDCLQVKVETEELDKELLDFFRHVLSYRSEIESDEE